MLVLYDLIKILIELVYDFFCSICDYFIFKSSHLFLESYGWMKNTTKSFVLWPLHMSDRIVVIYVLPIFNGVIEWLSNNSYDEFKADINTAIEEAVAGKRKHGQGQLSLPIFILSRIFQLDTKLTDDAIPITDKLLESIIYAFMKMIQFCIDSCYTCCLFSLQFFTNIIRISTNIPLFSAMVSVFEDVFLIISLSLVVRFNQRKTTQTSTERTEGNRSSRHFQSLHPSKNTSHLMEEIEVKLINLKNIKNEVPDDLLVLRCRAVAQHGIQVANELYQKSKDMTSSLVNLDIASISDDSGRTSRGSPISVSSPETLHSAATTVSEFGTNLVKGVKKEVNNTKKTLKKGMLKPESNSLNAHASS